MEEEIKKIVQKELKKQKTILYALSIIIIFSVIINSVTIHEFYALSEKENVVTHKLENTIEKLKNYLSK